MLLFPNFTAQICVYSCTNSCRTAQ